MTDFKKLSRFEPPASQRERELWLVEQEDRIARRVVNALAAIVEDATDEYLNTLTAAGDMGVFDGIPARWGLFVDNYLLDELSGMYLSGGLTAWITADAAVGLPERVVTGFTQVINQNAVDYAQIAQNRMKDVGLTTWNLIKDRVSKAVLTGESVEKTRDAIRTNTGFAKKRAEMIARTETINAFNNGDWAGDQALGEFGPVYKYWVATLDARGRETHIATNRQVKLMSEPFIVGGEEMLFPHSPGASAKNVVNCRCVYNKLWPGDPHPVTGEPMPEPAEWVNPMNPQNASALNPATRQIVEQVDNDKNVLSRYRPARLQPKDFDGQYERIMERAGGFDADILGKNGDDHLIEFWRMQGFDAKPTVISTSRFDTLADEGWTVVSRGISADDAATVDKYVSQFIDGDTPFAGKGMFGNGTYAAASRETAEGFTKQTASGAATTTGKVIDIAMHPDAKIIDFKDTWKPMEAIVDEERALRKSLMTKYGVDDDGWSSLWDRLSPTDKALYQDVSKKESLLSEKAGSWATVNGYDAIRIERPRVRFSGTDDDFVEDTYYVILNRGAIAVREME